ncbi:MULTISPECIES: DUF262 domain-containing protein [Acetobacteraceae]|uniref:DUF262 domain-containing protein n=2 Tax=Bombella apis TaxID=1785988 RepID=A0ABR9MT54_9PROT|nr:MULTISPECIES: DUF262 domain-containing protein [Acetobacteraceae]MBE1724425.1 DUF262 domain-containing protein [Bombella apis]MBR9729782.1 DUF262 domain-containing protein [Bombella apis]
MAAIESRDVSVKELFRDFYIVPSYQREYVWEKIQVRQLLEDIRAEQQEGGSSEYFIGSMVVCPSQTRQGADDLIDGQQRVTTLFIILCAIRDKLSSLGEDSLEGIKKSIVDVDTDQDGNDCLRAHLEPQYKDAGNVFNDLIEGQPIKKAETRSIKNISVAYSTVRQFLSDDLEDSREEIKKFFGYLIKNVKLIKIYTDSFGRALKIFETINDRGIGLNAMDLLKNLLFMSADERDFEDLKECWKSIVDDLYKINEKPLRFLRYFIFSTWGVPRLAKDELYEWLIKNDEKIGLKNSPVAFTERLREALEAYAGFLNKKDRYGKDSYTLENISFLYRKHTSARQYLVLLLAGRHLSSEIFSVLCRDIESFLFVCILVKEEIRTFEALFARWSLRLTKVKSMEDYRNFAKETFQAQKRKHANKFYATFKGMDDRSLPKYQFDYVLGKLTQHVDKNAYGGNHPLSYYCNSKEVHLEHILPKNSNGDVFKEFGLGVDDPRLISSIGNLALVEKSINMSLGNKPFSQKRRIYPKSRYLLTRIISERPDIGDTAIDRAVLHMHPFDKWDKNSIHQRAEWLADLACAVWDVPIDDYGKGLEMEGR